MSQSWIMVTLTYTRTPKTQRYEGDLKATRAEKIEEMLKETDLRTTQFNRITMDEVVRLTHGYLQDWPTAKLTMVRPPAKRFLKETERDNPRAFEIDEQTTKIIREDLDKALAMFAPIEQTIQVKPTTPRLEKESEDGSEKQD
jgi:hypothetical protein